MIREITRQQIDFKTAQGERVILVEAQAGAHGYECNHIPGAMLIPLDGVGRLAKQYLPDPSAEIVVYGADRNAVEVDEMASQLAQLGYGNVYVYRGGKPDWFEASGFGESVHTPPLADEVIRPELETSSKINSHDSDLEKTASSFHSASAAE